ncbi:MAG: hypothetical protein JXQ90_02385 [Cyclobacteriaceae bacterium]
MTLKELVHTVLRIAWVLGICSLISSCGFNDTDLFRDRTYQVIDTTGELTSREIKKLHESGGSQLVELNPGLVAHDTWYIIDLSDLSTSGYLEVTRPRTMVKAFYVSNEIGLHQVDRLSEINRNIVPLDAADETLLFKVTSMTRQVTLHFQWFANLSEMHESIHLDLFYIVLIVFLSSILLIYAFWEVVSTRKQFYIYFSAIQFWYLIFLLYDTGYSRYLFGDGIHVWVGRLSVLLYLATILPFIYCHFRPNTKRTTRILFLSSVGVILILFSMMVLAPITYMNSTIFVDILRVFRLCSPIIILYFYRDWFKTRIDFLFTLIVALIATAPILKSIQNARIIEHDFLEHSFSASMLIQSLLWIIYFIMAALKSNREKLLLMRSYQGLQNDYHKILLSGQEQERGLIADKVRKDIIPQVSHLSQTIHAQPKLATGLIDRLISSIRLLSRTFISPDLSTNSLQTELMRYIKLIQGFKDHKIVLDYKLDTYDKQDEFLLISLYRLVQEGISRAIAQKAQTTIVQVLGNPDLITVNIEHDGQFRSDTSLVESNELLHIKTRLSDYNYQLNLQHRAGDDNRLEVEILNLQSAGKVGYRSK